MAQAAYEPMTSRRTGKAGGVVIAPGDIERLTSGPAVQTLRGCWGRVMALSLGQRWNLAAALGVPAERILAELGYDEAAIRGKSNQKAEE